MGSEATGMATHDRMFERGMWFARAWVNAVYKNVWLQKELRRPRGRVGACTRIAWLD